MTTPPRTTAVEQGDPSEDHRAFRRCLGQFSTGVTVVTTIAGGKPVGVTANSFSSVSMEPPLILWSIAKSSRSFAPFKKAQNFAINILGVEQIDLSQRFATSAADKFEDIDWHAGSVGSPILPDILGSLECETEAASELPSLLNRTKHLDEYRLCRQHFGEPFDQGLQPVFWHHRDELVQHAALAEQRVSAPLCRVGLEKSVEAERFPGGAEQCQ